MYFFIFFVEVKDLYLFFIFLWISLSFFSQVTSKPIRIRRAMISNTKNPMCMHRIQKDDKDDSSSLVNFDQVQSLLKAFSVQVDLAFAEINHGILDYVSILSFLKILICFLSKEHFLFHYT